MQATNLTGTIAVTDYDWYHTLLKHPELEEINFWKPSARRAFRAEANSPFLFKLHSPHKAICGFGFFNRYSRLPDWLAWDCFGIGNGCESLALMQERISTIRARTGYRGDLHDSHIGCVLILAPIFFPPEMWVKQPDDWLDPIQSEKRYNLASGEGLRVWEECKDRSNTLNKLSAETRKGISVDPERRYGDPILITPRLGQGLFRVAVTESYGWGCAITNEHSLPALDAAHIRPFRQQGPHAVNNGLLLRVDLHRLFDQGYLTVTTDLRVEVSKRLKEDYQNGHTYYPLHGSSIITPKPVEERPAVEYLRWHNENIFHG